MILSIRIFFVILTASFIGMLFGGDYEGVFSLTNLAVSASLLAVVACSTGRMIREDPSSWDRLSAMSTTGIVAVALVAVHLAGKALPSWIPCGLTVLLLLTLIAAHAALKKNTR
jgi:hypothetical protein